MKTKIAVYKENKKDLEEKILELTNENNKNFKELHQIKKKFLKKKQKTNN